MTKLFKYRTAEVREYWIIDPDKEIIMVYEFEKNVVEQYLFGEEVPVGIYERLSIIVSQLGIVETVNKFPKNADKKKRVYF